MALLLVMTLLLVLPLVVIPRVRTMSPSVHSKELAVRILLALLAVAVGIAWRTLDKRPLRFTEWTLVGFSAAQFLAALFSGRFFYCLLETWHLWLFPLLPLVFARLCPSLRTLHAAVFTVATAGFITALYGFSVFAGFNPLREWYPFLTGEEGRNYMHSFLGNPEYFGSYMAPVAVLCLAAALRSAIRPLYSAMWAASGLFFLAAIALSGTRGAFLAFGLAAAVVALKQVHHLGHTGRRRALIGTGAVAALGLTGLVLLSTPNPLNWRDLRLAQRFAQIFDLRSASVRERIVFYALSAEMIRENPVFGSGPGTFKLEYFPAVERLAARDERAGVTMMVRELQNRIADHAHNDYLEFWAETGTIGFASLLLVLSAVGWQFFRAPSPGPDSVNTLQADSLRTAWFAAALCLFANAVFSFPLHLPARGALAWIAVGGFLAADRLRLAARSPSVSA